MSRSFKNASSKLDLYFIFLLAFEYVFINVMWFVWANDNIMFIVMLNITFALVITSYFSNIIFCLCSCLTAVFSYGSYIMYLSLTKEYSINIMSFFWIVVIPLLCIIVSFFRNYLFEIQEQIKKINEEHEITVGFDRKTNLLNDRMFHRILNNFIELAKRGSIKLCVMLIKINYYDDTLKLIGSKSMDEILKAIGSMIDDLTNLEDLQFFVDEKGGFALILNTDFEGAELLRKKLKTSIKNIDLQGKNKLFSLSLELKIGIAEYTSDITNSMDFRTSAEKDMEYDV